MDWTPYIPTDGDRQESQTPFTETNGCMPFAVVHCIEIQEKFLTGKESDYSEQALYQLSNTNPRTGNDIVTVVNAVAKFGLITTDISPEPINFTLAEFLTPIDSNIIIRGQYWLDKWSIKQIVISPSSVMAELETHPVLITIDLNNDSDPNGLKQYHEVVLLNQTQYFDSYSKLIKPLGTHKIYWANILELTPKIMAQIGTQNYKGELRLTLKASSPEQWAALCAVYGIDPNAPLEEVV